MFIINSLNAVMILCTYLADTGQPYEERLFRLGLQDLPLHRIMTDLIACYKLLNGELDIDCDSFLSVSSNMRTRG